MGNTRIFTLITLVGCFLVACDRHQPQELNEFTHGKLVEWNRQLTEVIISDIFTPPQASRIYAYSNVAAFETIRFSDSSKTSLADKLNGLSAVTGPDPDVYLPAASIIAFSTVAQKLVYDQSKVQELEADFIGELREVGINKSTMQSTREYGQKVGEHILEWAQADGYNERTALSRYTVTGNPGRWQPTPPDYMDAIEPHWSTLRPFILDSASQFDPGPPTSFDTIPDSDFYLETLEVYETVKNLDDERFAIAKFWDCNPNISFTQGHVMYYQQQISPGGHWIHIAAQVLEGEHADLVKSAEVLAKVSVTIADAFISCWSEKYRSNLIRPETYINQYIDQEWKPVLQTPAFPEHTSGHSVASASAAVMLTDLFGDQYAFEDSTEVPYGLPTRSFESFNQAAEEAAISRLYGGIHYRPAITKGITQGRAIGKFAVLKLNDHANTP